MSECMVLFECNTLNFALTLKHFRVVLYECFFALLKRKGQLKSGHTARNMNGDLFCLKKKTLTLLT
jgi:hypothetical protein